MEKDPNNSFFISLLIAFGFNFLGLVFLLTGATGLGTAFFIALPFAIGLSSGILPNTKKAILGLVVGMTAFSLILLATKMEGLVCVLFALPVLALCVLIGWGAGRIVKYYRKKHGRPDSIKASLAPVLIFFIASFLEVFSGTDKVYTTVTTSATYEATPEMVYDNIIDVDTVDVETAFLHDIGLPTPRKCVLTEGKVGGLRYCEFEEGLIVERIVELEENKLLRMKVESCKLGKPRNWLAFDEDIYTIEAIDEDQTKITRTTTYFSNLKPRKYWAAMEAITIRAEQDFVFRNLAKDLEN